MRFTAPLKLLAKNIAIVYFVYLYISPVPIIAAIFNISWECGIWPVYGFGNIMMLHRIIMNIIHSSLDVSKSKKN
jgi:hypothetical protein